jgi:hypothetical protein
VLRVVGFADDALCAVNDYHGLEDDGFHKATSALRTFVFVNSRLDGNAIAAMLDR